MASIKTTSGEEFGKQNAKFYIAALAAGIAIWVMSLDVEIDSTIQTLILTLSPIIVAYLWPEANRSFRNPRTFEITHNTSRKTESGFDPDVAVALAVAFVIYVGVQVYLGYADLLPTDTSSSSEGIPWWAKALMAGFPVLVGALTSPNTQ